MMVAAIALAGSTASAAAAVTAALLCLNLNIWVPPVVGI
jgi:hypothetical protein